MKRAANARKPPVVVPVVVVAVDVHLALVVPVVERGEMYRVPSVPLPIEYSQGCIESGIYNAMGLCTEYLHFLKCLHAPLYPKP
jgi:hypothetical protein